MMIVWRRFVGSCSLLIVLACGLSSCISSEIVMKHGQVVAEHTAPYDRYFESIVLENGSVAVLRDPDEAITLELYGDTLNPLWSVDPSIEGEFRLTDRFAVDDRKGKRHGRSLVRAGDDIGMIYRQPIFVAEREHLLLKLFKRTNGRVIETFALDTFDASRTRSRVRGGKYLVSPDRRHLAVYRIDYSDMIEREKGKRIQVTVKLFSTSGTVQGMTTAAIPMEGDYFDIEDAENVMFAPVLDNQGAMLLPVIREDRSLEIIRIDPRGGDPRTLKLFAGLLPSDEDITIRAVNVDVPTAGGISVGIGAADGDELMGVGYARLDESSTRLAGQWYSAIGEELAEKLVDDDLDEFVLESMTVGKDGAVAFTLEYQEFLSETRDFVTTQFYKNHDIIVLVFNAQGGLTQSIAFDKEQMTGWGTSLLQTVSEDGSALRIFYPDYEKKQLHLAEVNTSKSDLVLDRVVAEIGNNNYFDLNDAQWMDFRTLMIPTISRMGGASSNRLVKYRFP